MNTIIANNIYVHNASPRLNNYCATELIVTNPKYETLMRLNKQAEITRYHIQPKMALYIENGMDLIIPFGCLYAIWDLIKDSPYEIKLNQTRDIANKQEKITQPLFDYQEEAVQKMVQEKGGVLIGGCGSGKTNCGIEIAHRIGKNTLWLCHTKDLLTQTYKRIKSLYPNMNVGTITDGKVDMVNDGITISTIQTLVNVDPEVYRYNFEVVICDEAHHVSGSPTLQKYFVKVMNKIPARYKYGLTASDSRNDTLTKSMYTTIGCNREGKFEPTWKINRNLTRTLTAEHIKVDVDTPFDYCMLNDDGTFNYTNLVEYIATYEPRNDFICQKVLELSKEKRKQLILCSRIEQCENIHNKLLNLGIKSSLLIGKVSSKKRESILTEKTEWEVIVATVSLAKEGLDVTSLDTLHLASCLGNKSDTIQSVGRIERVCETKQKPIVLDYTDINIPYLISRYKKRVNWLKRR